MTHKTVRTKLTKGNFQFLYSKIQVINLIWTICSIHGRSSYGEKGAFIKRNEYLFLGTMSVVYIIRASHGLLRT